MSDIPDDLSRYAQQATKFDSKGERKSAILSYEIAIDILIRLIHQNPNSTLNEIYRNRIEMYEERIQYLKSQ